MPKPVAAVRVTAPADPARPPAFETTAPKPNYVSEFMFTFVNSGATDQIFSTARTGTACAISRMVNFDSRTCMHASCRPKR